MTNMKTMISSFALAATLALFSGCSDDLDPVLTQKDWDGTTTYFDPTDEMSFATYYKPYVGYVGDPMPFYDPVENDFKVLYLQEYRPNQTDTYHPIWALQTKDAASYTSLGELIPTGTAAEADAALGTGSTVYNESDGLYYTFLLYFLHGSYFESRSGDVRHFSRLPHMDERSYVLPAWLRLWL